MLDAEADGGGETRLAAYMAPKHHETEQNRLQEAAKVEREDRSTNGAWRVENEA